MHEIGRLYWLQLGCQMDHSEAEKWYKVASELGYAESQFALGQAYQYGTVAHPSHLETAAKYFAMAAQQVRLLYLHTVGTRVIDCPLALLGRSRVISSRSRARRG